MAQTNKTSNKLTNLDLSIQISLSGLSFCILNTDTNTVLELQDINFDKVLNPLGVLDELKLLFNKETALNNNFKNVTLVHDNELATLVPKALFNKKHLAEYLKFNSKLLKSDFIAYDTVEENNSVNVYIPYVNINNFIYDKFGTFVYKHISSILIESILQIEKESELPKVYVNINKNHFEIVVAEKGQLTLYNSFIYSTKEDFIYYILFTAEQLNLNPETFQLIVLGEIDTKSELYKIAYKYIRNISFGKRPDNYNYIAKPKSNYSNFVLLNSF
jgi:hypothetical protein